MLLLIGIFGHSYKLIDFLLTGSETEREAIMVNPITNKVYVTDSNLLYETDG
jgi:hypothetical protein